MYSVIKRILDIFISSILLLITLPFLIPICLILLLTAENEIFYFQERIGYKQQTFHIWKFATMLKNSPNMLTGSLTLRNDPRVTPFGKWLRITKLNELPQIINVMIGNMTIVGPRPQVLNDFQAYSKSVQDVIYNVKPGITGIGSIVFRDEEKLISQTQLDPHEYYREFIAPYKGLLEIWYQKNASISTDTIIVFLTAWQIFFPSSDLVYKLFKDLPPRPSEFSNKKGNNSLLGNSNKKKLEPTTIEE